MSPSAYEDRPGLRESLRLWRFALSSLVYRARYRHFCLGCDRPGFRRCRIDHHALPAGLAAELERVELVRDGRWVGPLPERGRP